MIIPSILEYSIISLDQRLSSIVASPILWKKLTKQRDKYLHLHLDFVMQQFAKERGVLMSLQLQTVFGSIREYFHSQKLDVSIHLMGGVIDIADAWKFFEKLDVQINHSLTIYVPSQYTQSWRTFFADKATIGTWYDIDEWNDETAFNSGENYLLMTVKAGKSGQKLDHLIRHRALTTVQNSPKSNFLLDGGWNIDLSTPNNTDVISYGSFWSKFVL